MEQPPPGESSNGRTQNNNNKSKNRMPSPREMVAHYENQGMDTQEASLKAIQDLQGALFKMVTANSRNKSSPDFSAKLDRIHAHLLNLEAKIDSKPSYPQAVAVGVASAGIWNASLQLWNTVRQATSSSPSSSSFN
ncbi:hypothetical protein OROMI_004588 [Orobanche minor]